MTSIINETDTDLTILEDYEFSIPCDVIVPCDNSGEWLFIRACCGFQWILCTPHKEDVVDFIAEHGSEKVWCLECGVSSDWRTLVGRMVRL